MSGENEIILRIAGDETDGARALQAIQAAMKVTGQTAAVISQQQVKAAGDVARAYTGVGAALTRAFAGSEQQIAKASGATKVAADLATRYNTDLAKVGREGMAALITASDKYGVSLKEVAAQQGVATTSLARFRQEQDEARKASDTAAAAVIKAAAEQKRAQEEAAATAKRAAAEQVKAQEAVAAAAKKAQADLAAAQTRFRDAVQASAQQAGRALTAGLTLPIAAAVASSVKAASDFESGFANVKKTLGDVSKDAATNAKFFDGLALSIRGMAKDIPQTTEQLSKIAALGGQFGISARGVEGFTRTIADLGVAIDGMTVETAAEGLAQLRNITRESEPDISRMASTLVHLGNNGASSEGQILEMSKRIAGAGKEAGLTTPQIMGIAAAVANVGIEAEAGGTAISRTFSQMGVAVDTGGEKLDAFTKIASAGNATLIKNSDDFVRVFKTNAAAAFEAFILGLKNSKEQGENLTLLMKEFGAEGARQADTLRRTAGAATDLSRQIAIANEAWIANNKHTKEAEEKYKTFANQLVVLWNRLKDVGIEFGTAILPALRSLLDLSKPVIDAVANMAKGFASLPDPAKAFIAVMGLGAAGAGPLILLANQGIEAGKSIANLVRLFKELAAAEAAAGAVGGLATNVGTLASAVGRLKSVLPAAGIVGMLGLSAAGAFYTAGKAIEEQGRAIDLLVAKANVAKVAAEGLGKAPKNFTDQWAAAKADFTRLAELAETSGVKLTQSQLDLKKALDATNPFLDKQAEAAAVAAAKQQLLSDETRASGDRMKGFGIVIQETNAAIEKGADARKRQAEANQLDAQYAADMAKAGLAAFEKARRENELYGYSVKQAADNNKIAETSLARYLHELKKVPTAAKAAKDALDAVGGVDFRAQQAKAIDVAAKLVIQIKALGGVSKLTKENQEAVNKAMHAGEDAMRAQGGAASPLAQTFKALAAQTEDWGKELKIVKGGLDDVLAAAKKAMESREFLNALQRGKNPLGPTIKGLEPPEAGPGGIGIAVKTDIDRLKEIEARIAANKHETVDWNGALRDGVQIFGDLAEIGGKGLDGILGKIARMIGLMATASQAGGQLGAVLGKGTFTNAAGQTFNANFAGFRNAQGDFTAGNVAAGATQAGLAVASGAGSIAQATGSRSRGKNVMGGMAAGAAMGANPALLAATGGWSVVVGAAVGAIVGAVRGAALRDITARVKKDFAGTEISEDLSKAIQTTSKERFRKDRSAAEIYHTSDIIKEGGGVKASNAAVYSARTRDAFSMLETGKFTVEDTRKVVDENFGVLAEFYGKTGRVIDKNMRDIIRLNAEMKTQSEEVKNFVLKQAATVGDGLARMLGDNLQASGKIKSDLDAATKNLQEKQTAASGRELGADDLKELNEAQAQYDELLAKQRAGAVATQAEFDRVGRLALKGLNAAVKDGLSYDEALDQIGGSLSALVQLQNDLGITTENRALADLIHEQALSEQYADRVDQMRALNDTTVAMANLNAIDAESFADLQSQGQEAYASLQEAGFSQESILRRMAPFLTTIRDLQAEHNFEIDDGTKKLIDQANASDLLGGKSKTASEIMLKGFNDLNLGIGVLIETLGGKVPDALKTARDKSDAATKDMKTGMEKVEVSAKNAGDAAARIGDKVREAADRGAGHWRQIIDDADAAARAVDGVSFGHSPGGLKEIVPMLRAAERQMSVFSRSSVSTLNDLQRVVDNFGWVGTPGAEGSRFVGTAGAGAGETFNHYGDINASAIDTAGLRELIEAPDGMGMLLLQAWRTNRRGMQTAAKEILGV